MPGDTLAAAMPPAAAARPDSIAEARRDRAPVQRNTLSRPPWADVAGGPLVAFRPFRLWGRDYARGDPVAPDVAEDRVLRNLYNARRINAAEPASPAPPAPVPAPPAAVAPPRAGRHRSSPGSGDA